MGNKIYNHICKHYHLYSFTANILIAIAMTGLVFVGVMTDTMTVAWLIGWGLFFAVIFFFGNLLNQEIDDMDKVKEHSCESTCDDKK